MYEKKLTNLYWKCNLGESQICSRGRFSFGENKERSSLSGVDTFKTIIKHVTQE